MKLSAILAPLLAAKVPYKVILETVLAYESEQADALEKRRQSDRDRQAKKRGTSRESRDPYVTSRDRLLTREGDARVEDITLNSEDEHEGKEGKKRATGALSSPDLAEFKTELSAVLDPELIATIVQSRRQKRAAINGNTGRLLSRALSRCPDPRAAAEEMVVRGWTSVKPDWLPEAKARGSPHLFPVKDTPAHAARRRFEALENGQPDTSRLPDDHQPAARFLPAVAKRLSG